MKNPFRIRYHAATPCVNPSHQMELFPICGSRWYWPRFDTWFGGGPYSADPVTCGQCLKLTVITQKEKKA